MIKPDSALSSAPEKLEHLAGPRKLVRPKLADQAAAARQPLRRGAPPLFAHQDTVPSAAGQANSHAEIFYLQKQIQTQTEMVFVLENGERIEGVIEWYDEQVIKVRHATRTMIYKSSIKYLFKASDVNARSPIPGSGC